VQSAVKTGSERNSEFSRAKRYLNTVADVCGAFLLEEMIGPLLIFDKSFVEMLNPEEVSELSMHFKFVGTPTLIGEIIADLKLKPSERRVPSDVVKALSKKMQKVHGLQPANYRKLALANLYAHEISMIGQVPVDGSAPNVHVTGVRRGVFYHSTPEQILWARWANGEFGADDELTASTWRNGIEQIDLNGLVVIWKEFSQQHLRSAIAFTTASLQLARTKRREVPRSTKKPIKWRKTVAAVAVSRLLSMAAVHVQFPILSFGMNDSTITPSHRLGTHN
jgi:hypothetical protein